MDEKEKRELEQTAQADLPETAPEKPDPRNESFINWKERMYDKIPQKKVPGVIRFLDFLIPCIFVAIVLIIIFGRG